MAPNQRTSQQKRPKTANCFLACFGFHPKTTNNTSSYKKKPKKFCARKKFFFKFSWPKKFKVITIDNNNNSKIKKNFKFDANKTAVLKASHNIMLEATKVHHHPQFDMIDHHAAKSFTTKEPILLHKGSTHDQENQSRPSYRGATCHVKDNDTPKAVVKQQQQPLFADKVTKDSVIGASIMVAMLIIMSIWGRLCAILCMCGWLYCVPFLRGDKEVIASSNDTNTKMDVDKKVMASSNNDMNTKIDVDFNSELYKKKVVLDGLLQRDYYQNAVGIS